MKHKRASIPAMAAITICQLRYPRTIGTMESWHFSTDDCLYYTLLIIASTTMSRAALRVLISLHLAAIKGVAVMLIELQYEREVLVALCQRYTSTKE